MKSAETTRKVRMVENIFEFARVILGIVIAFILCIVVIAILVPQEGLSDAIRNFMIGPFMSQRRFAQLLGRWAPYMLVGSGMCFMYAAGRFNVSAEGIINFAPMAALFLMFNTNIMTGLPQFLNLIIIVVVCMAIGGVVSLIPAVGGKKLGANEMVTSTILNFLLLYVSLFLVANFFADRTQSFLTSQVYPDNMRFTRYWGDTNFHHGFWWSVAGWLIACLIFYRTRLGLEIRMTGSNPEFARYAGINTTKAIYMGQMLSGIFAGAAAAVDVFGIYNSYYLALLTNIGFDGLMIAVMARKKPIFVPLTALVLAYIRTAGATLNANTNIPVEMVTMMQAVIVMFVAAENFLKKPREKVIQSLARRESNIEKGNTSNV